MVNLKPNVDKATVVKNATKYKDSSSSSASLALTLFAPKALFTRGKKKNLYAERFFFFLFP